MQNQLTKKVKCVMQILFFMVQALYHAVLRFGLSMSSFYSRSKKVRALSEEYYALAKVASGRVNSRLAQLTKNRPLSPALAKGLGVEAGVVLTFEMVGSIISQVIAYIDTSPDAEFSAIIDHLIESNGDPEKMGVLISSLIKDVKDVTIQDCLVYAAVVIGVVLRLRKMGYPIHSIQRIDSATYSGFSLTRKNNKMGIEYFDANNRSKFFDLDAVSKNPAFFGAMGGLGIWARATGDENKTSEAAGELSGPSWYDELTLADPDVYRVIQNPNPPSNSDAVEVPYPIASDSNNVTDLREYALIATVNQAEARLIRLRDRLDADGVVPVRRH